MAEIDWHDSGVPVSRQFDDPYYSLENGLEETRHVFLAGNDLPARFTDGFHIAELGFGTGLNLLATVAAWEAAAVPGRLRFTSFEAFPLDPNTLAQALAPFPDVAPHAGPMIAALSQGSSFSLGTVDVSLIIGDARETLPAWTQMADAWFLDGFSPAKNPELWEGSLMVQVAQHTALRGTVATYTAAGFVRRALADAGFEVTRRPGFGRKRHMTTARLP